MAMAKQEPNVGRQGSTITQASQSNLHDNTSSYKSGNSGTVYIEQSQSSEFEPKERKPARDIIWITLVTITSVLLFLGLRINSYLSHHTHSKGCGHEDWVDAPPSLCAKYTSKIFHTDSALAQYSLIKTLIDTAFLGNHSVYTRPNDMGILLSGKFEGHPVDLLPYFNGAIVGANRKGKAKSVNFLDGHGAKGFCPFSHSGLTGRWSIYQSNQDLMQNHMNSYFAGLLGCPDYGKSKLLKAYGGKGMYDVHKHMRIDSMEFGYFIKQIEQAAVFIGFAASEAADIRLMLHDKFGTNCSPPEKVLGQEKALQAICIDAKCPKKMGADCAIYSSGTAPARAQTTPGPQYFSVWYEVNSLLRHGTLYKRQDTVFPPPPPDTTFQLPEDPPASDFPSPTPDLPEVTPPPSTESTPEPTESTPEPTKSDPDPTESDPSVLESWPTGESSSRTSTEDPGPNPSDPAGISGSDSKGVPLGAIIGGAVGGLVFLIAVGTAIFFYLRRKKNMAGASSHAQFADSGYGGEVSESKYQNAPVPPPALIGGIQDESRTAGGIQDSGGVAGWGYRR